MSGYGIADIGAKGNVSAVENRLNSGGCTTIPIDERRTDMTKTLSLISLAVMSVTLGAQTPTSPQTSDPAMTPGTTQTQTQPPAATDAPTPQASARAAQVAKAAQVDAASINAELTKGLDAKHAHVGDKVEVKTTTEAKLADGTTLPRGTKLVGNVLDVTAKSKEIKNSRIVIGLNHAVLKDGKQVTIQSAVTSMTAPANSANAAVVTSPSGSPTSAGSSTGTGGSPSAPSIGTPMASDTQAVAQGAMLKGAGDQVPVGNKPKIILSAPNTPESSGILEAQGENVSLESGTKLTLNVIPVQA